MAKFGSYFGLCPLIDQRSLLGISEDAEKGNVLITLGKNIAMKYRLLDQNQITSWNTKEKFTSPVIFDEKTSKYVAVFNHLFIRCWKSDNSNLDKVKKIKFKSNINTVAVINSMSLVIFETGDVVTLEQALVNNISLIPEEILDRKEEYIMDNINCSLGEDRYVGLLVGNSSSSNATYVLWTSFDSTGNKSAYSKIPLKKSASELVGYCFQLYDRQIQLLTLWSDGKLYVKSIEHPSEDLGEMFCIIDSVSCKYPVSMVSLDKDYLAIYGSNSNQEGGLLIIFNMQFKVTQCKQPFKLQSLGVKLFKIQENLLVPVGQNLAVVPYHLEKQLLSALIGSQASHKLNKDIQVVQLLEEVNWTGCKDVSTRKCKSHSLIKEYLEQGFPESIIFSELLPELMRKNNIKDLKILLKDVRVIPEVFHAKLLRYILELPGDKFKSQKQVQDEFYPSDLQPLERYSMLKVILEKPLEEMKNNYWKSGEVLKLLKFILYIMSNDDTNNDFTSLVKWVRCIIFANCQMFLSLEDDNIVQILILFDKFISKGVSTPDVEVLDIYQGFSTKRTRRVHDDEYSIVKISL